eukprot:10248325-Alexandrium_andersonii.AAC.1
MLTPCCEARSDTPRVTVARRRPIRKPPTPKCEVRRIRPWGVALRLVAPLPSVNQALVQPGVE